VLTVSQAWLQAMRKQDVAVTMTVTIDAGKTYGFVFGPESIGDWPNIVSSVSGLASKLDPVTRRTTAAELQIKLHDDGSEFGPVRQLVRSTRLFSKRIVVKLGTADLALTDYAPLFDGLIEDVAPDEGSITLRCVDYFSVLKTRTVDAEAKRMHPLQIIYHNAWGTIGGLLIESGVPNDRIDAASFHPDTVAGGSYPMSHWNTGRGLHGTEDRVEQDVDAFQAAQEVNALLGGTLFVTEEGRIKFVPYDPAATAADTWTNDDVDEVVQKNAYGDILNRAIVEFGWKGEGQGSGTDERRQTGTDSAAGETDTDFLYRHEHNDTASQGNWAVPGATSRVLEETFATKWTGVESFLKSKTISLGTFTGDTHGAAAHEHYGDDPLALHENDGPGDTYILDGAWVHSFCGVERINNQRSDNATDFRLGESRTAFHMLVHATDQSKVEIIEVDGTLEDASAHYVAPEDDVSAPARVAFRIKHRKAFGDDNKYDFPPGSRVIDVTIPVLAARRVIERFYDGTPELSVTTNVSKHFVQLGDLVVLPTDIVLTFGMDGASASDRWEVVTKEVDLFSAVPHIKWGLKMVRPPPPPPDPGDLFSEPFHPPDDGRGWGDVLDDRIKDGFIGSVLDGNRVRITPGLAQVKGLVRGITAEIVVTCPPDTGDYHFVYDGFTNGVIQYNVAIGVAFAASSGYQQSVGQASTSSEAQSGSTYQDKRATNTRLISPEIKDPADPTAGRRLTVSGGEILATDRTGTEVAGGAIRGSSLKPGTGAIAKLDTQGRLVDPLIKDTEATAAGSDLVLGLRSGRFKTFTQAGVAVPTEFQSMKAELLQASRAHSDGMPYSVVVDRPTTNYIPNPSFENNVTDGWTLVLGIQADPILEVGGGLFGGNSARLPWTVAAAALRVQPVPAAVGEAWSASCWLKSTTGDETIAVDLEFLDGALASTGTVTTDIRFETQPDIWVRGVASGTAPAGTAYVRMTVRSVTQDLYFADAAQLERGTYASSYCDGSLGDGYAWVGAEHNSFSTRAGGLRTLGDIADTAAPLIVMDDGSVLLGGQANFRAFRFTSSQSIAAGATTRVVFNVQQFDDDASYRAGTGIFTCKEAGTYLFAASVWLSAIGAGVNMAVFMRQNGNDRATHYGSSGVAGSHVGGTVTALFKCLVGDTVDVFVFNGGLVAYSVTAHTGNQFSGRRVG